MSLGDQSGGSFNLSHNAGVSCHRGLLLQVVLAVDDSKSMAETGCGVFALEAVSLLAKSLARLEVGDVGLVSFGGGRGVVPLHPLTQPFTDADGPGIMSALRFDQVSPTRHLS